MKKFYLLVVLFVFVVAAIKTNAQATSFITTWKTDNPGVSNSTSITIPTTGTGYNYDVDWNNDGTYEQTGITGDVTHDFTTAGTYTIRIRGSFPRIYFIAGDGNKLINISQWGNLNWSSMASAFFGCTNLSITATDVPNLSTVTDMSNMFAGCSVLNSPSNIGTWNTAAVTNMSGMFSNAFLFNQSLAGWNTSAVTNMSSMFENAFNFNQNIGGWNTGAVTNMSYMFSSAFNFDQPIGTWNTAAVQNMSGMFSTASSFNQNISAWNTAAVTNMSYMFEGDNLFNQPLNTWNTSSVTNMRSMFSGAASFNQPLNNWVTSAVIDMSYLFSGASSFNQSIGTWNTGEVTFMTGVFQGASAFNQSINTWNTAKVTDMSYMFAQASLYNQPLTTWNTAAVNNMANMFEDAAAFNQPLDAWNTAAVIDMSFMFYHANLFDQNLGAWTLNSNVAMASMLEANSMSCSNYSATLVGWRNNPLTPSGRNLGAAGKEYNTTGLAARSYLTSTKGWSISDAGNELTTVLAATNGGAQVCQNTGVSAGKLYTDGNCNSIAMVLPNGASPVTGNVNTCVKIDAAVASYSGQPYVQRHFDITPATNPTTATERITLYVLQSEFNAFNVARGSYPPLPTDASDATGKTNLRVTKYSGTGTAPGNYTPGTVTVIDPADADITWNGYHWEISFNTTGSGGFYIHSFNGAPLPVSLLSFTGYKQGGANKLRWITTSEQNNAGFTIERSADGLNFVSIGFVNSLAANGNSDKSLVYNFTDANPSGSKQYYRLLQQDNNGAGKFSNVIVIAGEKRVSLSINALYPNPASSILQVVVSSPSRSTVTMQVIDVTGRVMFQQVKVLDEGYSITPINVSGLAKGSYFLKMINSDHELVNSMFMKQ